MEKLIAPGRKPMKWIKTALLIFIFLFALFLSFSGESKSDAAPPNAPASVEIKKNTISITYNNRLIFSGEMNHDAGAFLHKTNVYQEGEKIQQVILLTTLDWNKRIKISGKVFGSEESFPCEADRPSRGVTIVRHASGLSRSLRNRAVYDRSGDWVLSVDENPRAVITPLEVSDKQNIFSAEIEGFEIILRFRPRFFQKHRGLKYFEPWTYKVWPHSVAGWISWFAFFDKVTEKDIIETADVFSEALGPFGYEYLQIDDGYQRGRAAPELWLNPNEKFPHGLKFLADYVKNKGLKPGIWTAAGIDQKEYAEKHPEWFVRDSNGKVARGNWIDYALDASNLDALDNVVRPLYRGLRDQGWEYFKVDGLRHLQYEGYNANRDYFDKKKLNRAEVFRRYAQTIRQEIGRDHFLLGCWGIRPELTGIIDGCRIGSDGFSYAGLAQYNSFNNVVWRNDPDHIELDEGAYRSTMVTTLTGSLLLLTDKPEIYRTAAIEPAKRTVPVLFTLPGQLYDVDPSRSENLFRADTEVSGSGPRVFDASFIPNCFLYLLEISRPFDYWCLLGRTGDDYPEIRFADLGLDPSQEYFVFEFWSKKLLGSFNTGFAPGRLDPIFKSQAFCIRQRKSHPQLIATSRHITCGGADIRNAQWDGKRLMGKSTLVGRDLYILYLTEPAGYRFEKFECPGLPLTKIEKEGMLLKITLNPEKSCELEWTATYSGDTILNTEAEKDI